MAAYAALLSLEPKIKRHLIKHPGYLRVPVFSTEYRNMKDALQEIGNTVRALQILDSDGSVLREEKVRTWNLVEPQLLKRFPCEYPMVQFAVKDVEPLVDIIRRTELNASDIERIRDEAVCRLEPVLESLLSSLLLNQPLHQILAETEMAKQQINSFIQTVKKIKEGGKKSKNTVRLRDECPKISTELLPEITKHGDRMLTDLEVTVRSLDMRRSNSSRERMNALEVQIREAVYEIEDLLETRLTDQFPVPFPLELHEVNKHIPPFTQLLRKLKQEYMNELIDPLPEEGGDDDDDDIVSLRKSYGKNKSKMVGLCDEVDNIKKLLFLCLPNLQIVALFGMGGIGKTTVAEQVFDDPSTKQTFELRAWVEVGRTYQLKRIKQSILAQVNEMLTERGDDRLDEYLRESLKDRKYLIVLDDVWDDGFWDDMIKKLLPDNNNGSRVLLTTRRRASSFCRHQMRFLSKEESWELLCGKVFCGDSCPPSLKEAGKKIAESCEGLPLTILAVGELLSKVERNPEKWNEVTDNQNSLMKDAYERISKVLLPSYTYLTQRLKACFLYMVVFPLNYEISLSELFKLWVAEKFPKSPVYRFGVVEKTIEELYYSSLLTERRKSSFGGIKTWSLHSSFWHLCKREALKNMFSYIIESRGDSLLEGIKNQRRLCVHKNILFGIKDVQESIASTSTARSLLCTGPPHQYPVPICFNLKLLRVLNALTIRLYDFPMDVLKLFQLKYLALTCYENLPPSISKLWNLEILIFCRHLSIGSSKGSSYLPIEIWDMKELKHLQIIGSDLPDPCEGNSLPNLETLLDVSAHSCKECVFQGTPKLNKLGIRIELTPDGHATETLRCFDHVSCLEKLISLKCVVMNPTFGPHITPPPLATFPSSLEKLSLSGFGYPWKDMGLITSLPNLETLKLRCYAFRGPELEIKDIGFPQLSFLLIEDTDLLNWTVELGSLPKLASLSIKSCYKLENVTWNKFGVVATELVNCYKLENIAKSSTAVTTKRVW